MNRYTLLLIAQKGEILYNIRVNGNGKARPQNSLGLVPYQRIILKKEIEKLISINS